jgi:hypothetical protein
MAAKKRAVRKKPEEKFLLVLADCSSDAYPESSMHEAFEVTASEYARLVKPAAEADHPIDGATIDSDFLEKLREEKKLVKVPLRVIPIV